MDRYKEPLFLLLIDSFQPIGPVKSLPSKQYGLESKKQPLLWFAISFYLKDINQEVLILDLTKYS